MSSKALDTIEEILERGDDADTVLRRTVEALASEPAIAWAGLAFLEGGALQLGPSAGKPEETRRVRVPVSYEGEPVGELLVDGDIDPEVLARIGELVSPYVLIGWDTGGEPWEP